MVDSNQQTKRGLIERLDEGPVICAEGYLFECERRGYLQAGAFVPEVVMEHPEIVESLHREFVHAGSDVVEAFTYYAHKEKLRVIGKEDLLEPMNRQALRIAKRVADETGTLMCGDLSNTNVFVSGDAAVAANVRRMFEEQVRWALEEGADFIVAETFTYTEEAEIATEVIKAAGAQAVVTMAIHRGGETPEGHSPAEACRRLEAAGADVVGLNCARGPWTILPLLKDVRDAVKVHVAALPVPYRTTEEQPTFQSLHDSAWEDVPDGRSFPTALDPFTCNRYEIGAFAREAYDLGVHYLGVCCGAAPHHIRAMAEALGRTPPASRYSADMSKHAYFGKGVRQEYQELSKKL